MATMLIVVDEFIDVRIVQQYLFALRPTQRRDERLRQLLSQGSEKRRREERLAKPVGKDDKETMHHTLRRGGRGVPGKFGVSQQSQDGAQDFIHFDAVHARVGDGAAAR